MFLLAWVKRNKLASLLLVIIIYFLSSSVLRSFFGLSYRTMSSAPVSYSEGLAGSTGTTALGAPVGGLAKSILPPQPDYTPQTDTANRLVIENSNLSLLVTDVVDVRNKILGFAQSNGGYMVNANVNNPQDAPTAQVTIRIPSAKLNEALNFFHGLAIKVVSENLNGTDVTDQYVDIEKHITILESTKTRYEQILQQAQEVSDITNLTQQIIQTQNQIDSYKGQQDSLAKNAELAKVTIYLSTDEIALPYAPSETFRPEVIFKLAVRSLVGNLRDLASIVIWVIVYGVIWIPLLIISVFVYRKFLRKPV